MFYGSLICLLWAVTSFPLIYCIPVGGAEPLQLVDVVGAPTDDVSCPVRESDMQATSLVMDTDIFA